MIARLVAALHERTIDPLPAIVAVMSIGVVGVLIALGKAQDAALLSLVGLLLTSSSNKVVRPKRRKTDLSRTASTLPPAARSPSEIYDDAHEGQAREANEPRATLGPDAETPRLVRAAPPSPPPTRPDRLGVDDDG